MKIQTYVLLTLTLICILSLTACEKHADNTVYSPGSPYNAGVPTNNPPPANAPNNPPPNSSPASPLPTNSPTDIKSNPYK
jgi:hypothetical protein